MLAKFDGSHIKVNKKTLAAVIKAGISFIPEEGKDKCFDVQYVEKPVIPPEGYTGDVDDRGRPLNRIAYLAWLESLPTIWEVNPAFRHWLLINPNTTLPQLEQEIQRIFTPDVLTSADEFLSIRGTRTQERRGFSSYRKMMAARERLGNGLVLPKGYNGKGLITAANNRFRGLGGELDGKGKILDIKHGSLDIGADATDRAGSRNIKINTLVGKDNPANEDDTITAYEIFISSDTGTLDIWLGTFSEGASNVLTCRDSESIGDVDSGSKQTGSGLDIDALIGDYLGVNDRGANSAWIEFDSAGFAGVWEGTGELIDPSDSDTFGWLANCVMSLYGEGEEGGETLEASVTFAGSASMTVNAVVTYAGAVTFSGEGALSVNAFLGETLQASIVFSGAGALSINAVVTYAGVVSFSGEASMTVNAVMTYAASVGFAGVGTLSVNATIINATLEASVTFSGSGSLAILGGFLHSASITFGGVGTLSIFGGFLHEAKVFFLGRGLMSCNGVLTLAAAVAFAGEGFMTIKARYLGALFVECVTTHYRDVEVLTTHNKQAEALTTHNKQIDSKITGG